jgi:hypothetical protein
LELTLVPDWAKFGLVGLTVGAVLTILSALVLRVMPARDEQRSDRDERWLEKVLSTFSEQSRLEREQCAQQYRDTLSIYHQANIATTARDTEIMSTQRELVDAQRATTHALHDLAKAVAATTRARSEEKTL